MIISNLVGGLGNQMFQYACGRALALDCNQEFKVVHDMFGLYTFHNGLELEKVFRLTLRTASRDELGKLVGHWRSAPRIRKALGSRYLRILRGKSFVVDADPRVSEGLPRRVGTGAYLHGYWQSPRFFQHRRETVLQEFQFRQPFSGANLELAKVIQGCESVGIHVRRGDYVSNAKTNATHGICSPEYYLTAIDRIRQHFPASRLFAFSDDPQWVVQVLGPAHPSLAVISHNRGTESYNDMRLMAHCKHNIIANSTFSWWSAWLNLNPDKIVYAPQRWFAARSDSGCLIPENWRRL